MMKNPSYVQNGLNGWETRRARANYIKNHGENAYLCIKLMASGYRNEEISMALDMDLNSIISYRGHFNRGTYRRIIGSNR